MNTRKKGYYRDQEIKKSIELFEVLIPEQICILHFYKNGIKNWNQAMIKTRERLRKINVKKEKVNIYGKPYCYYTKKPKDKNFVHVINRNWGYIFLINQNKYFKLTYLKHEYRIGNLQADGFTQFYSIEGNKYSYWFIESDRIDSHNEFTKIKQYNDMYANEDYIDEYWNRDDRFRPEYFPKILIICDSNRKIEKILNLINKQNKEKLEFYVISIDEIKEKLFV